MNFGTVEATTTPKSIGQGEFRFVKLQVRLTNSDGTPNNAGNVLVGDSLQQVFELVPGVFSDWLPTQGDLFNINVMTLSGTCTVAWVGSDYTT